MPGRGVLAIGVDPALADRDAVAGLTPDVVRAYIDAQLADVRAKGYGVKSCLICVSHACGHPRASISAQPSKPRLPRSRRKATVPSNE